MKELLKIALVRGDNDKLYVEVWEAVEFTENGGTYRQIEHVPVSAEFVPHKTMVGDGGPVGRVGEEPPQ